MGVFRQSVRALLVLLILVSFASVQSASAIEIHPDHHGADDHCCAGGHAGHFPALQAASTILFTALAVSAWHTPVEANPYTSDDGRTFNFSRAPPA